MKHIKSHFLRYFEHHFVFIILLFVSFIYAFSAYKTAILNIFFIPVLVAGYYLGVRAAVKTALFCIILAGINSLFYSPYFKNFSSIHMDIYLQLLLWSVFLTLTGVTTGRLHQKLEKQTRKNSELNGELGETQQSLTDVRAALDECLTTYNKSITSTVERLEKERSDAEVLKRRTEEVLHMSIDPRVAQLVLEGKIRNEKRHISVLVTDLEGFTSYTEQKQPEQVIQELNLYFSEMSVFIRAFHAHLEKYTGDGFMLEFGAPIAEKNHVLQATICGWRMTEHMQQSNFPWKMRLGLTSGNAVLGMVGCHQRSYVAMGNCANTAFRLEAICPAGSMLIDEETYSHTKDYFEAKVFQDNQGEYDTTEQEVKQLELILKQEPDNIKYMLNLAHKYLKLEYAHKAEVLFTRILILDTNNQEAKIGYAEASILMSNRGTSLKGRSKKHILYELTGIKNLYSLGGIPVSLQRNYETIVGEFNLVPEQIWPSEISHGNLGHSSRVALLSCALADRLSNTINITESEIKSLIIAAHFHDIGLQNTCSPAKQGEPVLKHEHHEESAYLMHEYGFNDPLAIECVLNYHLSEDNTHPIFHILLIVDFYDTLTSSKPWRDAWEPLAALKEMQHEVVKGKVDNDIFNIFSSMIESYLITTKENS